MGPRSGRRRQPGSSLVFGQAAMVVCRPRRRGCDAEAVPARAEPSVTPRPAVAAFARRSGGWDGQQPNERCCRGRDRARRRDGSAARGKAGALSRHRLTQVQPGATWHRWDRPARCPDRPRTWSPPPSAPSPPNPISGRPRSVTDRSLDSSSRALPDHRTAGRGRSPRSRAGRPTRGAPDGRMRTA
jgi:hypothetical protein